MFAVFVSSTGEIGDAHNYKIYYERQAFDSGWIEDGNDLMINICRSIGLHSYNQYLIVLFLLSSVLFFIGFKKMKGDYHVLFALSLGFIFPTMTVAIRFFLAFSIFVFCLPYLAKDEKIKYLIGIIIASFFHRSAIFFLLFVFVKLFKDIPNKRKTKKILSFFLGTSVVICIAYTFISKRLPFIDAIAGAIVNLFPNTDVKVNEYFGTMTRFGALILFAVYFANYILSKELVRQTKGRISSEELQEDVNFGHSLNIISSILLPLTILNLVFFRLYIAQTVVNCISLSKVMEKYPTARNKIVLNRKILMFGLVIISWSVLAVFKISSISVHDMLANTFLCS